MSSIAIPISGQVLWNTGDVRLWATIRLSLKNRTGSFVSETLLLDCGSEITTFPAYHANLLGLPMPANPSPGVTHIQTGLEIRSGALRFQIAGMDSTEYATNCLFLGDPAVAPASNRPAAYPRKLLQPFALLDHLRFAVSKDPVAGSLYGDVLVEKK